MVKKVKKTKSFSQKLKNGTQKILSSKNGVKKLAATLPLTAILVEEVRAAQGLTEAQLAEFELAQELKKNQANVQAMAITGQEVSEDLEEATEFTESSNDAEGEVVASPDRPYDNDLLLASADDASIPVRSSSSSDDIELFAVQSNDGGTTNLVTELPSGGFELAGLPVAGLTGGVFAGVGAAAVVATNNAGGTTSPIDINNGNGTHLQTSLKELQALGVNSVNVAGTDSLHVDLGSDGSFSPTGGLPLFGDADRNGLLTTQERDALTVSLDLNSASQLNELAGFGADGLSALSAAGIDQINLLDNVANLSVEQASLFVQSGLSFASNDVVTVGLDADAATGTHMATSLKELQKLGVDAVNVTGTGDTGVNLDFGDGAFTASGLPTFNDSHDVTLNVNGATNFAQVGGAASAFDAAGIDHIHLTIADQTALESAFTTGSFTTDISALHLQGIDTTLDMLNNQLSINSSQASLILDGGVHLASNDTVTLQHSEGTQLASSLSDLHKLGVDAVQVDSGITDINLEMGDTTAFGSGQANLPVFAESLDVTLHIANDTEFAALSHIDLAAFNIDNLSIDYGADLDTLLVQGVDVLNGGTALATDANYGQLIDVLIDAGLADVALADANDAPVTVTDDLAAALHQAGMLHALPTANIEIDATGADTVDGAAVLHTSLNTMAELGVDKIDLGSASKAYVEVDFANHADVAAIVSGFTQDITNIDANGLFGENKEAGLVIEESELTAFNSFTSAQQTELLTQLSELGFTEIDVLKANGEVEMHAINTSTQQAPVLDGGSVISGTTAQELLDIFGADINDKPVA